MLCVRDRRVCTSQAVIIGLSRVAKIAATANGSKTFLKVITKCCKTQNSASVVKIKHTPASAVAPAAKIRFWKGLRIDDGLNSDITEVQGEQSMTGLTRAVRFLKLYQNESFGFLNLRPDFFFLLNESLPRLLFLPFLRSFLGFRSMLCGLSL